MWRAQVTYIFYLVILSAVAMAAIAQEIGTPGTGPDRVLQQQGLHLTLIYEGRSVLGEPIVAVASVRNAGGENITVQKLTLSGSGLLERIYGKCSMSFSDQTLRPAESIARTCTLVGKPLSLPAHLYRSTDYRLLAEIKTASRDTPVPVLVDIKMAMPELSVVYGALAGVLLLVLFRSSYQYLQAMPKVPLDVHSVRRRAADYLIRLPIRLLLGLIEMILRAIQGGVVAIILIVLARTTTELSAPIVVRVDDFWGGLVVGIFSVPLADWLAEKLGIREPGVVAR